MISFLSRSVVRSLIKNDMIEMEKAEVYQYGFEILISTTLGLLITVAIGIVLNMFFLSVFYYHFSDCSTIWRFTALFYCSNAFFHYICNVSANMRRISCKSLLELQFTVPFGNQCGIGCISFLSY